MTIEIIDTDKGRGNIIIVSGKLKTKEYVEELWEHLTQDAEKFRKYNYSLVDYTAVKEVEDFPSNQVQFVADMCKKAVQINPDIVVALVADKDLIFGLVRMWEILMDEIGWDTMVFKTRDGAENWIKDKVGETIGMDKVTFQSS